MLTTGLLRVIRYYKSSRCNAKVWTNCAHPEKLPIEPELCTILQLRVFLYIVSDRSNSFLSVSQYTVPWARSMTTLNVI